MENFRSRSRLTIAGLGVLAGIGAGSVAAHADVLSSNLTSVTGSVETAQGSVWLAASFKTGASAYRLDAVTLLLANATPGAAELDVYADGGLEPGSPVGTLTPPASYATSLTATTFTAGSLVLTANTTYWLVLKANSGAFNWAWTTDATGAGTGFTNTWGEAADAGQTWYTDDVYPLQMTVNATPAAPGAVSGRVALDGVPDLSAANPAASLGALQILFRTPGTLTTLYTSNTTLTPVGSGSPFGAYTSNTVPAGTYDIAVKTSKNLRVVKSNVIVYGPTTLPDVTLPAGDANGDNMVDVSDFGVIVNAYGSQAGNANYDPAADLNYDGIVDVADFGLLVNNYGAVGDL